MTPQQPKPDFGHGPLAWLPAWSQLTGYLPDGVPDPQAYNDCGETCVAMVVGAVHGVPLEAGSIRQTLGGSRRTGLTTGKDLVDALKYFNVAASVSNMGGADALIEIRARWANAYPVICLGKWLPGIDALHWCVAWSYSVQSIGFCDPYTGTRRSVSTSDFLQLYARELVLANGQPHYDMSRVPTPGSNG